jgi:hypothetical protein
MSWESFYLVCFFVGLLLSLLSFFSGVVHLHVHVPKSIPHLHSQGGNSPVNLATLAAFLAWFGGTGYLLSRYSTIWTLVALGIAMASGAGGGAVMFWFLFRVLLRHERDLDPADYDMIGVLGRVSGTVYQGGTGEMIFSQAGARRSASIRGEDGQAIPKGVEVVVTRYERGIAYVRPWEELSELKGAQ